jgi:queuine tRNA-ribosyltransferase
VTIKQARWTRDPAPLDAACACYTCRRFSRAYLRHLFVAEELLAYRLLTLHNVHFYLALMRAMRDAIVEGAFEAFRARFYARYAVSSVDVPLDDPQRSEA